MQVYSRYKFTESTHFRMELFFSQCANDAAWLYIQALNSKSCNHYLIFPDFKQDLWSKICIDQNSTHEALFLPSTEFQQVNFPAMNCCLAQPVTSPWGKSFVRRTSSKVNCQLKKLHGPINISNAMKQEIPSNENYILRNVTSILFSA